MKLAKNGKMDAIWPMVCDMSMDLEVTQPGIYRYRPERLPQIRDDFAHRARLQVEFARALSRAIADPDLSDTSKGIVTAVLSHCIEDIDRSFSRYGRPFPALDLTALVRSMQKCRISSGGLSVVAR